MKKTFKIIFANTVLLILCAAMIYEAFDMQEIKCATGSLTNISDAVFKNMAIKIMRVGIILVSVTKLFCFNFNIKKRVWEPAWEILLPSAVELVMMLSLIMYLKTDNIVYLIATGSLIAGLFKCWWKK